MSVETLQLAVGSTGADATLTVRIEEVAALAELPAVEVPLPAGRWLVTAMIGSKPEAVAPPAAVSTKDVTLSASGSVTTDALQSRIYRSLDAAGSVYFSVTVNEWSGTDWDNYATTWSDESSSSITLPQVATPTRSPLWGAAVHVFIPLDRPAGSLDVYLDKLEAAGMQTARTSLPWPLLQPTSASFDSAALAKADAFMEGCDDRGMKAIVILGATAPGWAEGSRQYIPADWDDYGDYVSACLSRWGNIFAAIETTNEPNVENTPFTPADVVMQASTAKAAIGASGLSGIPCIGPAIAFADADYLAELYDAGIKTAVDAFNCHPYAVRFNPNRCQPPDVPWGDLDGDPYHLASGLDAMRQVMADYDDAKDVWVTEYGFSTSFTGANKTNSGLDATEAQQAAWLELAMRQAAAIPYCAAFTVYLAYDNAWTGGASFASPNNNVANWLVPFGLMDHAGIRTKPAYTTVTSAIAALP